MKTILFNAFADDDHARRLDMALDLVRSLDGHLTIVNAMPFEAAYGGDPYGATFAVMTPIWREESRKLRERTERDLANEGVSWDWADVAGPVGNALLERSQLADLIVLGAREPRPEGKAPSSTAGELALTADCPVLVLPDDEERIDLTKPALVGWDGSAEASHALRAAVPLLKHCGTVYLASVKEKKDESFDLPPVEGADYLSRHGIHCEIVEPGSAGRDTAKTLRDAAIVRGCGLMVMGAYGRMRLAERIFGGVTRSLLSDPRLPLLLRH